MEILRLSALGSDSRRRNGGVLQTVGGELQSLVVRQLPRGACQICTRVHLLWFVLEWDPGKAEANRRKQGVDFADAATALSDEHALTQADDEPSEDRFPTLGMDALGRILLVVYSWRGDLIRWISARKSSPSERKQYERHR